MKRMLACCGAVLSAVSLFADGVVLKNDNFQRQLYGWNTPSYWPGKTTSVEEGGKKYLQLESGVRNREVFGRALGYSRQIDFFADTPIRIQVRAKGSGKLIAGVLTYPFGKGTPAYLPGVAAELSDSFRTFTFDLVLPGRFRRILPYLQINGEGRALVESFKMETMPEKGVSIEAKTPMQIVKTPDAARPLVFASSLRGEKAAVCRKHGTTVRESKVDTGADGSISLAPETGADKGIHEISVSAKGAAATAYIDMQDPSVYDRSDALAKTVRLPKKYNILVIGDSLSDFYRGQNYLDRLFFWLDKYNPGRIAIRNAGVGGDYVQRVAERLAGTLPGARKAYRQNMYDNLFAEPYDLIFIFLGQNDTRSRRVRNFEQPLTSPEEQEKGLRKILDFLGERSKARVVLIAPSPSYVKIFEDRAAKLPPKADMVMFGRKELVDRYDAVNRKFCAERKLDYVDILSVMRAEKDLKSLYVSDGVHLSPEGGRLIADTLLKYFAGQFR